MPDCMNVVRRQPESLMKHNPQFSLTAPFFFLMPLGREEGEREGEREGKKEGEGVERKEGEGRIDKPREGTGIDKRREGTSSSLTSLLLHSPFLSTFSLPFPSSSFLSPLLLTSPFLSPLPLHSLI